MRFVVRAMDQWRFGRVVKAMAVSFHHSLSPLSLSNINI